MKKFILIAILLASFGAKAQQDLTLYYMENITQRTYLNPAFAPKAKFHLGLPVISSIYLDHINTTLTPNTLFETSGSTSTLNVTGLKEAIQDNNYFGLTSKIDLFSIGFKLNKSYFSFNVTENIFTRLNLSRGLLEFPLYGTANFEYNDGVTSLENFGLNATHYREFGLGWQREFGDKLNIGAKFKLLSGLSNIYTKSSSFKITTDPTTFDITASGEMEILTSGHDSNSNISNGEVIKYLTNFENIGMGLDVGVTYKVTKKLTLDASVIDMGFISWASEISNFKSTNGSFVYSGLNLTEVLYNGSDTVEEMIEQIIEDAEDEFNIVENKDEFSSPLLTRIHLGGTYELYDSKYSGAKLGMLFQSEIYQNDFRPSFTLSYNQSVGRWLNASASYSMVNRSANNLGLGLSMNLGSLQLYLVTDNVFAAQLTALKSDEEIVAYYPSSSKKTHVHFGINLTFGTKRKDTDEDGVPDKDDKCPEVFGLEKFEGCPDSDADGVQDSEDNCPNIAGTINGCPDSDKDGIIDSKDKCPKVFGLEKFEGCPDTDGDGIEDSKDKCPKVKGTTKHKGCPDTDGDGVIDSKDKCVNEKGDPKNNGCPWGDKDMDEVLDNVDKCPEVAGAKDNNGCPWGDKDMDEVLDNVDKCPEIPGPKENNGCPYPDFDKDGVPDKDDKCPEVAGIAENNGCPDGE